MQGATVHPVLVELSLPGGGSIAIRSYGVAIALSLLLGWYLVVHGQSPASRNVRARAYAVAVIAGGAAGAVGSLAGPSNENPLTAAPSGTGSSRTASSCRRDGFRITISIEVRAVCSRILIATFTDWMRTGWARFVIANARLCGTIT